MRLVVLGSGMAPGIPRWDDQSETALRARASDPFFPPRNGAALAITSDDQRYSILEAPLHLSSSLARWPEVTSNTPPRAVRVETVVLTSAELDACAGILGIRSGLATRVASPPALRSALIDHNSGFRMLEPLWSSFHWDKPFPLDRDGDLEARFFPLPGPVPDHLATLAPRVGRGRSGVRITDLRTGIRVVWAPRITQMDTATLAELRAADLRFIDGTFLTPDEASRLRPGAASPSELGHLPIESRDGSLPWLSGMRGRSLYIHLASTNPLCDEASDARKRVLGAGVEIASDGMEFEL